jgi:hypothetical protein
VIADTLARSGGGVQEPLTSWGVLISRGRRPDGIGALAPDLPRDLPRDHQIEAPRSRASAAMWASEVSLPAVPVTSSRRRRIGQCCAPGAMISTHGCASQEST